MATNLALAGGVCIHRPSSGQAGRASTAMRQGTGKSKRPVSHAGAGEGGTLGKWQTEKKELNSTRDVARRTDILHHAI